MVGATMPVQYNNMYKMTFTGGRTNTRCLYKEVVEVQKIGYVDYTSLYPYINKYGRYPIKHPQIITEDFEPLENEPYFGLIKV